MDLTVFFSKPIVKQGCALGSIILIVGTVYCMSSSEVSAVTTLPGPSSNGKAGVADIPVTMPKGNNTAAPLTRDIFALPLALQEQPSQVTSAQNAANQPRRQPQDKRISLQLTGIASMADKRVAVIRSAGNSQTYQLNEMVGNYQLIAIDEHTVLLSDSGTKVTLSLEEDTQQGGNYNAQ
ncbi:MAG TPA: type II secretion system protein N [Negativicutes bacterium]